MRRKVLLVEAGYKNKYPPLGLMKISTYHKMLGDEVHFFKGDLEDFVRQQIIGRIIEDLKSIDGGVDWVDQISNLDSFLKNGKRQILSSIISKTTHMESCSDCIVGYKDYFRKKIYRNFPEWDRIFITSLFTFYWNKVVDTANFAKYLVKEESELYVGGIATSILSGDFERETGIKPFTGLLDKGGELDWDNDILIDTLPLDYSILEEIEYRYPEAGAFYAYSTRGCIRKCRFCAVPSLEPEYKSYISLKEQVEKSRLKHGDRRNLMIMDNNILASDYFEKIIDEIVDAGFGKNSTYIEPDMLSIYRKKILRNEDYRGSVMGMAKELMNLPARLKGEVRKVVEEILQKKGLTNLYNIDTNKLLEAEREIYPFYHKYRNKSTKKRRVDFNQGIDVRLVTEKVVKQLSRVAVKPLRIAFDSMLYAKEYVNAVKLSSKYGLRSLSNYLLYNEEDLPVDLYRRVALNVELSNELGINIYSFPMKFHPVEGEISRTREYIGKHWNRKFIRAIQVMLNATKGKIGSGRSFFYRAFGNSEEEFLELLYMPEAYIFFRHFFENTGHTQLWRQEFSELEGKDLELVKSIIEMNNFNNFDINSVPLNMQKFLKHYQIKVSDVLNRDTDIGKAKQKWDIFNKNVCKVNF